MLAVALALLLLPIADAASYPGGLANHGCHYCRTNCQVGCCGQSPFRHHERRPVTVRAGRLNVMSTTMGVDAMSAEEVNRVELCAQCGAPCLSGEIGGELGRDRPNIRWGERCKAQDRSHDLDRFPEGAPICDPCFQGQPEPPSDAEVCAMRAWWKRRAEASVSGRPPRRQPRRRQ